MKIAIYSGSFNPLHRGHIAVARYLLDEAGFDKVYLVVSPRNPFKDENLRDSARERFDEAVQAIASSGLEGRVIVDDIELHLGLPSYTIKTLDALRRREPHNDFTFVIGGDNLPGILEWEEGERILAEYGIIVYPREGFDIRRDADRIRRRCARMEKKNGSPHRRLHIKLLTEAPLVNVSSTQVREMLSCGMDVTPLCP